MFGQQTLLPQTPSSTCLPVGKLHAALPTALKFARPLHSPASTEPKTAAASAQPKAAPASAPPPSHHDLQTPLRRTDGPSSRKRRQKRGRLDEVCMALAPHLSRNVVQSYIIQGKVRVDGRVVLKAGTAVPLSAVVDILAEEPKYVCRAGHKLEAALAAFNINPSGLVCLDSGVSTGGFTDCLLQHGAAHVFGIDVAYGQVANKVRRDERVTLLERFNVRHLTSDNIPVKVDLATLDLSFISVLKVLSAVLSVMHGSEAQQQQLQAELRGQQQLEPSPSMLQGRQQVGMLGQQQQQQLGMQTHIEEELHRRAGQHLPGGHHVEFISRARGVQHTQGGGQWEGGQPTQELQQLEELQLQGVQHVEVQQQQAQGLHHLNKEQQQLPTGQQAQQPLVRQQQGQSQIVHAGQGIQHTDGVQQLGGQQQQQAAYGSRPPAQLVVLIKPQFEAGRAHVCSGGVVHDPQVHLEVLTRITQGIEDLGFGCQGIIESPLRGDKSGNIEFLGHYVRGMPTRVSEIPLLAPGGHRRQDKRKQQAKEA